MNNERIYTMVDKNTDDNFIGFASSLETLLYHLIIKEQLIDELETYCTPDYLYDYLSDEDSDDDEITIYADFLKTDIDRERLYNYFVELIKDFTERHKSEEFILKYLNMHFSYNMNIVSYEFLG